MEGKEIVTWLGIGLILTGTRHSWKEDLKSSHNCSSWAIEVVNYVMGEEFVKCDRPKQLKYVQLALEALKSKIKRGVENEGNQGAFL